jgi:hypothetical protein
MFDASWLYEWSSFRWALVDETARCVAKQIAADGHEPEWDALTREKQTEIRGHVTAIFLAQDQAVQNLAERGIPF